MLDPHLLLNNLNAHKEDNNMCTYTSGNHRCSHHRDYDPVIKKRNIDLPDGISLIDEGYIDEDYIDPEIEVIENYIGHELSYMTRKLKSETFIGPGNQIAKSVSRNVTYTTEVKRRSN